MRPNTLVFHVLITIIWSFSFLTAQESWEPISIPGYPLVFDSNGNMYVCSSGVLKSDDEATSWLKIFSTDWATVGLAINSNNELFTTLPGGGVYRSSSGGTSWELLSGLGAWDFSNIVIDINDHIYVGYYDLGLYKSSDNGDSWTDISTGLPDYSIEVIEVGLDGTIFVGSGMYNGLLYSVNGGADWTQTNLTCCWVHEIELHPDGSIYTLMDLSLMQSVDLGNSWTTVTLPVEFAVSLKISQASGTIYIGAPSGEGVYRSIDGGASWEHALSEVSEHDLFGYITLNNSGEVFAVNTNGATSYKGVDPRTVDLYIDLMDGITLTPLSNSDVIIAYSNGIDENLDGVDDGVEFTNGTTDASGQLMVKVPFGRDVSIIINSSGYLSESHSILDITTDTDLSVGLSTDNGETEWEFGSIISPLVFNIVPDTSFKAGIFDIPPAPGSTISSIEDAVSEYFVKTNSDYSIFVTSLNTNSELVPSVAARPSFRESVGTALCKLSDVAVTLISASHGLPSGGFFFNPFCGGPVEPTVYQVDGKYYQDYELLPGVTIVRIELDSRWVTYGAMSTLDHLVIDDEGRMTGSYYENGILIEDRYEIPNVYYSGHESHPNVIYIENPDSTTLDSTLLYPTELGNYTHKVSRYQNGKFYGYTRFGTAVNFDPIIMEGSFPDSMDVPQAVAVADKDTMTSEEIVTLDGSNSYDPKGLKISFAWIEENDTLARTPIYEAELGVGNHLIELLVTNEDDLWSTDYIFVVVKGITQNASSNPNGVPFRYTLHQNYPNPFNPTTTIRFDLPIATDVHLAVYDLLGREIVRLVDRYLEAGYHHQVWNARDRNGREVPTGIYFVLVLTPEFRKSIKTVLLK